MVVLGQAQFKPGHGLSIANSWFKAALCMDHLAGSGLCHPSSGVSHPSSVVVLGQAQFKPGQGLSPGVSAPGLRIQVMDQPK
jgi:hypothetical protein